MFDVAPGRARNVISGIGNVRAARQFLIRRNEIRSVSVAAVNRNEVSRRLHARAVDPAVVDRVAQSELPVTEIIFASIAQRGETFRQPDLEVAHAPERLFCGRHPETLAGGEIAKVAENVCMAINHTGHDEGIGEIDDLYSLRRRGSDAFDSMIFDGDVNVRSHLAGSDIE